MSRICIQCDTVFKINAFKSKLRKSKICPDCYETNTMNEQEKIKRSRLKTLNDAISKLNRDKLKFERDKLTFKTLCIKIDDAIYEREDRKLNDPIIKRAFETGDFNLCNEEGETPLIIACRRGDKELCLEILKKAINQDFDKEYYNNYTGGYHTARTWAELNEMWDVLERMKYMSFNQRIVKSLLII